MVWKKRLRTFSLLLDLQRDRLARLLQQTDGFTQRFPLQAAAVDRKNTVAYMDRTSPVNNTKTHRNIHSGFSNSKIILDKTLKKTGTELTVSGKHKYTYTQNRNENHFCRKEVKTQLMMRKIIIFKQQRATLSTSSGILNFTPYFIPPVTDVIFRKMKNLFLFKISLIFYSETI